VDKKIEISGRNKIYRKLANRLSDLGFERTKTSFFTRPREHVVEFIHLHKFTFCAGFRVHFGIRVLNDPLEAAALNGPSSEDPKFSYDSSEESLQKCANEIHRFCKINGERWFRKWSNSSKIINSKRSPLQQDAKKALLNAIEGRSNSEHVRKSKAILGIT
jgi:hypothetical protein